MTNSLRQILPKMQFLESSVGRKRVFLLLIAGIATTVSVAGFIYYFQQDLTTVLGDGRSRLSTANRVLFSQTPGLSQLGGVWLPLPSILMIPTIWSDFMYYSGLSGSIVSMFFFIIGGVALAAFILRLTGDYRAAFIGTMVFILNPAMIYIQTTQMTESMTIGLGIVAAYLLLRWSQEERRTTSLISAAFVVFLLTLTRYEGWFFALAAVGVVGLTSYLRYRQWNRVQGDVLIFSSLAFFGIAVWLLYNQVIFGDFLNFTHQAGSTKYYVKQALAAGNPLTIGDLGGSIALYIITMLRSTGFVTPLLALVGFSLYCRRYLNLTWHGVLIPLLLFVMLVFHVVSLYTGQTYVVNRYGLYGVLPVAAYVGFLLAKSKWPITVLAVLLLVFQYTALFQTEAASLEERIDFSRTEKGKELANVSGWLREHPRNDPASSGIRYEDSLQVSSWLREHPSPSQMLISYFTGDNIIFLARLPFSKIVYEGNQEMWTKALEQPRRHVGRIIVMKNQELDPIKQRIDKDPEFLTGFELSYDGNYYQVYDLSF